MDLFDLVAKLTLDKSDYDEGLGDAEKGAKNTGGKLKSAFGVAAKAGAGLTGAAVAAGAAVFGMSKKSADTADHIDKMSQKLGLSREAYQELDFILSQSGTSVDNLRGGMKTLTAAMTSASEGTESAQAKFDALGISIYDSNGNLKDQETMLWETLTALNGMEDGTQKAALANDLLGKSGAELMPLLNGASGSIESMRQEAHDLGLVLGDDVIDSGVVLTDTIDKIQRSFGAIGTQIGAEVMPLVQNALNFVLDHMPQVQAVLSVFFNALEGFVSIALSVFGNLYNYVAENVVPVLSDIWEQKVLPAFEGVFQRITAAWENILKPALSAIWSYITDIILPVFTTYWTGMIQPAIEGVFAAIRIAWDNILYPVLSGIFGYINDTLLPALTTLWTDTIQPALEAVFAAINTAWETILLPAFEGMAVFLNQLWVTFQNVWETLIQPLIESVFNTLKGFWDTILYPVFVDIAKFANQVWTTMQQVWETNIQPMVQRVFDKLKSLWDTVLLPVFTAIAKYANQLWTTFQTVWETNIKSMMQGVFGAIKGLWNNVLMPVFAGIAKFLNQLWTTFQTVWKTNIQPLVKGVFDAIKGFWDDILMPVFAGIAKAINNLKSTFETVFNAVSDVVSGVFDAIAGFWNDTLSPVFDGIGDALNTIKETWDNVFSGIQTTVDNVIGGVKTTISEGIDFIKGLFNFEINFPKINIPTPHVEWDTYSGWFGSFSLPRIAWNRKAEANPYLFTNATLFGAGEGNDEMLYGHASLMKDIKSAVSSAGGGDAVTINVYATPGQDVEELAREIERTMIRWEDQRKAAGVA